MLLSKSRGCTPQTTVWLFVCSARGYIRWTKNHCESNSPQKTTTPSTISCCILYPHTMTTSETTIVCICWYARLISWDFQYWEGGDNWMYDASTIVDEQALEECAHPSKISDNVVCRCYYWMFILLTPISGMVWYHYRDLLAVYCLHNSRRASLRGGRPEDGWIVAKSPVTEPRRACTISPSSWRLPVAS